MIHQKNNIVNSKKLSVVAAFMAFVCFPIQEASAEQPMGRTALNFTDIAKEATPAVVSVKVKSQVKSSQGNLRGQQDSFDFFNDEFFNQFFGRGHRGFNKQEQLPKLQSGQGSGFIATQDGYILTNSHVVKDAEEITVVLNDEREFNAELIGIDTNTDIAVIKIHSTKLPFLSFGSSDELEVGQWVVAIGNPLGLQASVTAGVVSAKGRNGLNLTRIEDFIQTDAAINRGNSGGPLLNLNGEVIGMNTAIVTNMGSGGYMGIGFAIPSHMIQHIMKQLINDGSVTRGFIGVTLQQINNDLAQAFEMDKVEGALIADITEDSPANKAGLKQGDVILEFNNKKVSNIGMLRNGVSLMKPGTKLQLTVLREGERLSIPLTISPFPEDKKAISDNTNKLGIEVGPLTAEAAKTMGYAGMEGVLIIKVDPSSSAALAGLKKGTLIVALNHKKVKNIDAFNKQLAEVDKNKPLLLLIKQDQYMHFVSIKAG